MSDADSIAAVEAEWEPDTGFVWKVRQGEFDPAELERTLKKLRALPNYGDADIPRRLVSLLWYMPLVLEWQVRRVREAGGNVDSYIQAVSLVRNEVERILGVP